MTKTYIEWTIVKRTHTFFVFGFVLLGQPDRGPMHSVSLVNPLPWSTSEVNRVVLWVLEIRVLTEVNSG